MTTANDKQCGGQHYKSQPIQPSTDEVWASAYRFDGLYEVSSLGRVRSLPRSHTRPHHKNHSKTITRMYGGQILSPKTNRNGYVEVGLWANNTQKFVRIHRLVAHAFCLGGSDALEVNHIDGNIANNVATNLEWVTRSENHKHAYAHLGRLVPRTGKQAKSYVGAQ